MQNNNYEKKNRFEIINYYESILKEIKIINNTALEPLERFSKDKLTKSLQKVFYKRLNQSYHINILFNLKKRMLSDIKDICKKIFKTDNIILLNMKKKIENIFLPYIYNKSRKVSFRTNDITLFNFIPIIKNPEYNIINTNIKYEILDNNNIFYISNLDNLNNNIIKCCFSSNFIFDLKSDIHNINEIRVVSLNNALLEDDDFDIYNIFQTWATLLYLNIHSIIEN